MRTYLINLSNIPSSEADGKFFKKVFEEKLEWWRYFPLSFILLTPDNIYTNTLTTWLFDSYGAIFFTVMEIQIKDIGGIFPAPKEYYEKDGKNPFAWFTEINKPDFVPKWEKK